jgi:hypothetical protein
MLLSLKNAIGGTLLKNFGGKGCLLNLLMSLWLAILIAGSGPGAAGPKTAL